MLVGTNIAALQARVSGSGTRSLRPENFWKKSILNPELVEV
jgi:hypothetical protein